MQSRESGIAPTIEITGEKYGIMISTNTNDNAIDERSTNRFQENSIKRMGKEFDTSQLCLLRTSIFRIFL